MKNPDLSWVGVGLRPTHYPHLETLPVIQSNWFEAISENYMNTEGRPLEMLLKIRSRYPVALHGVSLSIGSDTGIREDYLKKLKKLIERVEPAIVSDHVCWAHAPSGNSHDLLPLPFNREALQRTLQNIDVVQSHLGRSILLENISYYLKFKESQMDEAEFLVELCRKSGCKLLLDLNNVYVNAVNHEFNPVSFIEKIPTDIVGQMHVAGPSQETGYLFDTHSSPTRDAVWKLLELAIDRGVSAPLIVEWDQDIPDFSTLEGEVVKARNVINQAKKGKHAGQSA
ncbi:MAG: DUF692 domain-containing protein [Bdellovibrionales bacterium]